MPANVLSADDATFDTSIGNWTGTGLSRVTTPTPHAGSGVLRINNTGLDADLPLGVTPQIPAGHIVTVYAWMRQSAPGTMVFSIASTSTSNVGNYFATGAVVPTASWQQQGASYIIVGTGTDTATISVARNSGYVSPTVGYISDAFIGHEPVNPPTSLTVTDIGGDARLDWVRGPDQWVGYLNIPAIPQVLALRHCNAVIERSAAGGAYTVVRTQAAHSSDTWTDTGTTLGVEYRYRVRYSVYVTTAKTTPILGYSAYSNVATFQGVGGWAVGSVRMGA